MFYTVQKREDFVLVSRNSEEEAKIFCTNILSIVDEWQKMAERMEEDIIQYGDGEFSVLDAYVPLVRLLENVSTKLSGLYFEGYLQPKYSLDTRMEGIIPSDEYLYFVSRLMEGMIHILFVDIASIRKKTLDEIVERITKMSVDKIATPLRQLYMREITAEEFKELIK